MRCHSFCVFFDCNSVYATVCVCVAGTVRRDWPIAGSRVVNDVRGRRPRGEFSNRQRNTDDVSVSCFMAQ